MRSVIKMLTLQERAGEWNAYLSENWINQEDTNIYYIDGHVQVYHGYLANLGKKHVSRQKLTARHYLNYCIIRKTRLQSD